LLVVTAAATPDARAAMGSVGPTIDSLRVGADPVPANAAVSLQCTATQPTAGNVRQLIFTVSAGTLPGGGTVAVVDVTPAPSTTATVQWSTPEPGTHSVKCDAVNDVVGRFGGGNASSPLPLTISVPVVLTTPPPVVTRAAGPADALLPGDSATLAVEATDPGGLALSYAWSTTGGELSAAGSTATWKAPDAPGTYSATVTVTSAAGLTATTTLPLVVVLAKYGGPLEPAFGAPQRIAVSPAGDMYVVDGGRRKLTVVTRSGKTMGDLPLAQRPLAVAYADGELAVSTADGRLLAVDPASGRVLRTVVLGGNAVALAHDPATGLLWLAERSMDRVRALRRDGSTAIVLQAAGATPLRAPAALAVDAQRRLLWVALASNSEGTALHAFTTAGVHVRSAVPFGGGAGQVTRVGGIALDAAGKVYVSDIFQGQVQVVTTTGAPVATLGQFGSSPGQLLQPADLAVLPTSEIVVLNQGAGRLERFAAASAMPATCAGDADCDGMPDAWELAHGLDPLSARDALLDGDGDGLTNLAEYRRGTDPRNRDTDGDGVADGDEIARGTDPLDVSDNRPQLLVQPPKESDPGLVRFQASIRNGTSCTVAWRQRLGPRVLVRDADTLTPSFVGRAAGRYQFEGTATCGGYQAPAAVLEATIRNLPPRADPGRLTVASAGGMVTLDARGSSDPNGDALSYEWNQSLGAPIAGGAAGPLLPLRLRRAGYFQFELTARDAPGALDAREVPVLVLSDRAETPTAVVTTPLASVVGNQVVLDASGSIGPQGLAWSWTQVDGPPVTLAGAEEARATFAPQAAGKYAFEAVVSAGALRSPPARVEVYVAASNALPLAQVVAPPASVTTGEPVALDGSASAAAAGGTLGYRWRQVEGPAAGLTDGDRPIAAVVPFQPGTYGFELLVTENGGVGLPAQVRFVASAPGAGVPTATASGPGTAYTYSVVRLDGSRSRDPQGRAIRYRWTQIAGPWVALDDPASGRPTFVPREAGVYSFELEVEEGATRSAPASVSVLVFSDVGGGR
jgi:hypothetical protein